MENLDQLRAEIIEAADAAASLDALETVRVEALGKKGRVTALMKGLGGLDAEARKTAGQELNALKDEIAGAIEARKGALADTEIDARLAAERVDVTLPARPETEGRIHPISQTIDEVTQIFGEMGFLIAEGPDIEDDFHNFTALNIPPEHPARQMHDTFYLASAAGVGPGRPAADKESAARQPTRSTSESADASVSAAGLPGGGGAGGTNKETMLLRTHTSPVQIRHMQAHEPPYRILVPGRTYRCDSDMTHTPMFHQFEGLVVDETTHMGHLKGCLIEFCRAYFEVDDVPVRFRASHFPFTEPSAEVDIGCSRKGGELRIGAGDDWLEILGCGMVHPNVLEMCGVDSTKYQGFAFGMGVERVAMLKYGIPDLRTFFEPDIRWLKHYGFVPLDIPSMVGGLSR